MSQTSWEESIRPLREEVFDPLRRDLHLRRRAETEFSTLGYQAAESRNLCIYFEHDRGLSYLAIGAAAQSQSLCEVDLIARRFPRIRLMPEGEQRLTLQEQADFLRNNWEALQIMFSPTEYASIAAWRAEQARAHMQRLARGG